MPTRLSDKRWEAHNSAVSAAKTNYDHIQEALHKIVKCRRKRRHLKAQNSLNKMDELEFFIVRCKPLQDPEISLETCATLYSSLVFYIC